MLTIKKIAICITALFLLLVAVKPASADIAPWGEVPGSSINPTQKTNVRMVAENVVLAVKTASTGAYIIEVTADFAMKNMGDTDEQMQVRFPMEDPGGEQQVSGKKTLIKNFQVSVNQETIFARVIKEPYSPGGIPVSWSVFDVKFSAGKEVLIHVSYVTDLQNELHSKIEYVLGTGSGWFDTIGSVVISVRLPYAASEANIISYSSRLEHTIVGNEIRYLWKNYDPPMDDTFSVFIVHPSRWKQILYLEGLTGEPGADVNSFVALSKAYQEVSVEKHGCMINPALADLSELAIEQGLSLYPNDVRMQLQLAEVYFGRLNCVNALAIENQTTVQNLRDKLKVIFTLDPKNERALTISQLLDDETKITPVKPFVAPTQPPSTPVPTATRTLPPTAQPSNTPTLEIKATTIPPNPTATAVAPGKDDSNSGSQILGGALLLGLGFVIGAIFMNSRRK